MRRHTTPVEDYTTAFLAMAAMILFMAFLTLAAIKGLIWVLASAALIECALRVGERQRAVRGGARGKGS